MMTGKVTGETEESGAITVQEAVALLIATDRCSVALVFWVRCVVTLPSVILCSVLSHYRL